MRRPPQQSRRPRWRRLGWSRPPPTGQRGAAAPPRAAAAAVESGEAWCVLYKTACVGRTDAVCAGEHRRGEVGTGGWACGWVDATLVGQTKRQQAWQTAAFIHFAGGSSPRPGSTLAHPTLYRTWGGGAPLPFLHCGVCVGGRIPAGTPTRRAPHARPQVTTRGQRAGLSRRQVHTGAALEEPAVPVA